ncbi:DUF4249 domain-containing protein [Chitinophaga vietnamensis]|uniref:DUF4249 domain-containing protein n=1 Tax=Chitinophaga vietnamensis TaxID=2593957 RepID=UPI0013762652|nr:DUF4249 domain-containing protein [Chitinophaga vietnamensis]
MQRIFVYAVLLVMILCGCERRVDINLPYEGDRLVINSLIQPDSVVYARVTRSIPANVYNEGAFAEVRDAGVTLEEDGKVLPMAALQIGGNMWYVSSQPAVLGRHYKISASKSGLSSVYAADTLPPPPNVSNASAQRNSSRVRFTLKDRPGAADYYRLRIFAYGPSGQPDTMRLFRLDPSFNNNVIDVIAEANYTSMIMSDERFDGKTLTFVLQTKDPIVNAKQLMIEVSELTYNSWQYLKTASAQLENSGSIVTEPVRVFTNVVNGYGIVGGINTRRLVFKVD